MALEADGSLYCAGEVPENAVLTLLAAPMVDPERTVRNVVRGLRELGPVGGRAFGGRAEGARTAPAAAEAEAPEAGAASWRLLGDRRAG